MIDVWVVMQLSSKSELKIQRLREALSVDLPDEFKEETEPHISILPGAKIPDDAYDMFAETVATVDLPTEAIQIDGLSLYPLEDPYVILLDVVADLSQIRETLVEDVHNHGGHIKYPPVDPHITLFKTADEQAEAALLSDSDREQLHTTLTDFNARRTAETRWKETEYEIELRKF